MRCSAGTFIEKFAFPCEYDNNILVDNIYFMPERRGNWREEKSMFLLK